MFDRYGPIVTTFVILFVFTLNRVIIDRSTCTEATKVILFYIALVVCSIGQIFLICTSLADSGTLLTGHADEECASLVGANNAVPYCDSCNLYQINNAAHCTFCDCCVEDLDHHCKDTFLFLCTIVHGMAWHLCFF